MKKILVILAVTVSGFVFGQDSNYISPFYSAQTSQYDLTAFDLNSIFNLEKLDQILSERYGYRVICEDFVNNDGFADVFLSIAPYDLTNLDCTIFTNLSVIEQFYNCGTLKINIDSEIKHCVINESRIGK